MLQIVLLGTTAEPYAELAWHAVLVPLLLQLCHISS